MQCGVELLQEVTGNIKQVRGFECGRPRKIPNFKAAGSGRMGTRVSVQVGQARLAR